MCITLFLSVFCVYIAHFKNCIRYWLCYAKANEETKRRNEKRISNNH